MQTTDPSPTVQRPPHALRLLDIFLWVCAAGLALLTIAVAVFVVGKGLGGDAMRVEGLTGDVRIEHTAPSGEVLRQDLAAQREASGDLPAVRFLSATVQTEVTDTASKLIIIAAAIIDLGLAWFALINVRRLTSSALRGAVFTRQNANRIARVGAAAMAFPILSWWVGESVFDSVVTPPQVGVSGFLANHGVGPSGHLVAWVGVGLLLFTIARAFRWGVELQEFEAAVI